MDRGSEAKFEVSENLKCKFEEMNFKYATLANVFIQILQMEVILIVSHGSEKHRQGVNFYIFLKILFMP